VVDAREVGADYVLGVHTEVLDVERVMLFELSR